MLSRMFFVCLSLSLYGAGCSLSCRWLDGKFKEHSDSSLVLLDAMANNSTNTTDASAVEDTVGFPNELYSQASEAATEYKLAFTVQILEEVAALFEEDHSLASWEQRTADDFVNVVAKQAGGLRSCIGSHGHKNKKLHRYFTRLSRHLLKKMGHSAAAWEMIRKEIQEHLNRVALLFSPLLSTNRTL
ncbi:interferon phi 4 [Chelmon rostratus]|uniref:interferon phi 4 n=1 Tax=Chelmon rostratus TaxID=109905 RepID=UPI001BE7F10F|nr:interferon phi 4 [Chelmon rostratus]